MLSVNWVFGQFSPELFSIKSFSLIASLFGMGDSLYSCKRAANFSFLAKIPLLPLVSNSLLVFLEAMLSLRLFDHCPSISEINPPKPELSGSMVKEAFSSCFSKLKTSSWSLSLLFLSLEILKKFDFGCVASSSLRLLRICSWAFLLESAPKSFLFSSFSTARLLIKSSEIVFNSSAFCFFFFCRYKKYRAIYLYCRGDDIFGALSLFWDFFAF